jgi:hypothetical protein
LIFVLADSTRLRGWNGRFRVAQSTFVVAVACIITTIWCGAPQVQET